MNKKLLKEVLSALGGIMWLENNMHNYGYKDFEELLLAAMRDVNKAYWKLKKEVDEME